MMALVFNPSTKEDLCEFQSSRVYVARPCLKKQVSIVLDNDMKHVILSCVFNHMHVGNIQV